MVETHQSVLNGIRLFMRLQSLDVPERDVEWTASISDVLDALSIIGQCFTTSARFSTGNMYQTSTYDFIDDIKDEIEEFLLVGENAKETALKRRKNITMYHLIIGPIIDSFRELDQDTAIACAPRIVALYTNWVNSFDDFGDDTDGIVAQHQIRAIVSQRDAERKAQLTSRKQRTKKKIPPLEVTTEE